MDRRTFCKVFPSLAAFGTLPLKSIIRNSSELHHRTIPSSGEQIPAIGLGTWIQFDIPDNDPEMDQLKTVLEMMLAQGGKLIDSSPMYGRSEANIGDLTSRMNAANHFFYATKVWTSGEEAGKRQIAQSMMRMQRDQLDLLQIHNLLDWSTHIKTLINLKSSGKIRYIGITHYTDSSHRQLADVIKSNPEIDFVQCNYSIEGTHADEFLFPIAQDHDVAVIINTPFNGGSLFRKVRGKDLPNWATDLDINSWGQFFLKYILSHPAVTCAIPGTSNPKHLMDNMGSARGTLPDMDMRKVMKDYFNNL